MPVTEFIPSQSIAQSLFAEFEQQAPLTRKFLERLPEDKLTWRPHPKSMTAGQLGRHIAYAPGAVIRFVQTNPAQLPDFESFFTQPASREEILSVFDAGVAAVRNELPKLDDASMNETWRLQAGDRQILAQPRCQFLRDVMFSHIYQHRGQLGVYLRLLDVPVPATWGPSADERPEGM